MCLAYFESTFLTNKLSNQQQQQIVVTKFVPLLQKSRSIPVVCCLPLPSNHNFHLKALGSFNRSTVCITVFQDLDKMMQALQMHAQIM